MTVYVEEEERVERNHCIHAWRHTPKRASRKEAAERVCVEREREI